jgi:hypothetical protein
MDTSCYTCRLSYWFALPMWWSYNYTRNIMFEHLIGDANITNPNPSKMSVQSVGTSAMFLIRIFLLSLITRTC